MSEEERGAVQRLLTVSEDMALSGELHEEVAGLSTEDVHAALVLGRVSPEIPV
jgi:hypothetical protein